MICEHREWLPEDEVSGSGEQCQDQATHLSCVPYKNTLTCVKHKCRCAMPLEHKSLTGQVFGLLTVGNLSHRSRTYYYYTCLCQCGNVCVVSHRSLTNGNSKSCGCLRRQHIESVNKARRHPQPWAVEMQTYVYHLTVDRTKRQHLAEGWTLSLDDYIRLSTSECFYCGREPFGKPASKVLQEQGVKKNGIDRVDNSLGYTSGNCVSCCGPCNREKGALSLCDFIEATWRRYHHLRKNGLMEDEGTIAQVGIHQPDLSS